MPHEPAMGSVGRPVRLDPYQNIIEVGWGRVTHIAFGINLDAIDGDPGTVSGTYGDQTVIVGEPCSGASSGAGPDTGNASLVGVHYSYGQSDISYWNGSRWRDDVAHPASFTGLRTEDNVTIGDWVCTQVLRDPLGPDTGRLHVVGGATLDMEVPDGSGDHFTDNTSCYAELYSRGFTSGPYCSGPEGGDGVIVADLDDTSVALFGQSDDLIAGISAMRNGHTFIPIGTLVRDQNTHIVYPPTGGQDLNCPKFVWVLLKREDLISTT